MSLCRVTVVGPERRVDLALPEDLPVAELMPELLTLSGQAHDPVGPIGFRLIRLDGSVLDADRTLGAHQVRDGELLRLRPAAETPPAPVYDDVVEAIADGLAEDRSLWTPALQRATALAASVVLLLLCALSLRAAGPGPLTVAAAATAAALLVALSGVQARIREDHAAAVALGLGALPFALLAGVDALPGDSAPLLADLALLATSSLLTAMLPSSGAPLLAAAVAAALVLPGALAADLTTIPVPRLAALTGVLDLALIGFLPSLGANLARLPLVLPPEDHRLDGEGLSRRARRGHELLTGLLAGCAVVAALSAAVLAHVGGLWPDLLALALTAATSLRARAFRRTAQVLPLLGAALLGLTALLLALHAHGTDPFALAGAAALATVPLLGKALRDAARPVSPFWSRALDLVDATVLASLIPLALGVLDAYAAVRSLSS